MKIACNEKYLGKIGNCKTLQKLVFKFYSDISEMKLWCLRYITIVSYLPMRCALYSFIPLLLTGKYFTTGPPESPYSRLSTIAIDGVHMPT